MFTCGDIFFTYYHDVAYNSKYMILSKPELKSVLFAKIFQKMLGLSCSIISTETEQSKHDGYIVHIDNFERESLLREYERRYGELAIFHSHMSVFSFAEDMVEEKECTDMEDLLQIVESLITNPSKEFIIDHFQKNTTMQPDEDYVQSHRSFVSMPGIIALA